MYERETSMNSLNPARHQNFANIEHRLLRSWHILCVRAGLAEVAGPTPALPRNSRELLEAPNRNFNEVIVNLAEPSIHGDFRSPASAREFSDGPSPTMPQPPDEWAFQLPAPSSPRPIQRQHLHNSSQHTPPDRSYMDHESLGPLSPVRTQPDRRSYSTSRSPELAVARMHSEHDSVAPLARTYSDNGFTRPMSRTYSDHGSIANSPFQSPNISYNSGTPSDIRTTSHTLNSYTPHSSPFQPGSRGSTNFTNLSLPSSSFHLASM
jgi:hypothetical protein